MSGPTYLFLILVNGTSPVEINSSAVAGWLVPVLEELHSLTQSQGLTHPDVIARLEAAKDGKRSKLKPNVEPAIEPRNCNPTWGARIKEARQERGLSQQKLGELAGVNVVQTGLAERGLVAKSGKPAFAKLEAALELAP
jgi:ribosome-binding protein aMBF1 (putative translation factor)